MNIVFIITRSDVLGGAQIHVRDLAWGLLREGHSVTVLVGGRGPFTDELERMGIPFWSVRHLVRPIRPYDDVLGIFELRRALVSLKPDLVTTHSSKAGWLGRLAAHSLGLPVVFTVHGWAFTEGVPVPKRQVYLLAEQFVSRFSSRIITVSEYDRKLALRHQIAPPHKIVAIHNGIPDVSLALRARPEVEPVRLVMVARFEAPKDHVTLLRALAGLRMLPWELELIGDGPLMRQVQAEVRRLELTERVTFLGARNDVAERLAQAQTFVLVSMWEGFPLSVLEAMRAGLPVVASDVGGVREAVVDGETGFLIPPGSDAVLRARLQQLIMDASLRIKMGKAGRRRFEHLFTFERMFKRTMEVYESVLEKTVQNT